MDAVSREDIVLSERFLSPDWEKYDCHSSSIVQAGSPDGVYQSTAAWIDICKDGGRTWEKRCDLEEKTGEFPAAIQTVDGTLHVTYAYEVESGQRRIKHVAIDPSKLFND
jgi:hypothetical protein